MNEVQPSQFDKIMSGIASPEFGAFARGLSQAGAPSRTPVSFGQALGHANNSYESARQQAYSQRLNELLAKAKIEEIDRKRKRDEMREGLMERLLGGGLPSASENIGGENSGLGTEDALMKYGLATGDVNIGDMVNYGLKKREINRKDEEHRRKIEQEDREREANRKSAVASGQRSIQQVEDLLKHNGFENVVGRKDILSGAITDYNPFADDDPVTGMVPPMDGTDEAGFVAAFRQIKGEQFMEAIKTLKGGGQITEIEGKKGTDAISRMDLSQTEEEFKAAAKDYIEVIRLGMSRAQAEYGDDEELPNTPTIDNGTDSGVIDYTDYFK